MAVQCRKKSSFVRASQDARRCLKGQSAQVRRYIGLFHVVLYRPIGIRLATDVIPTGHNPSARGCTHGSKLDCQVRERPLADVYPKDRYTRVESPKSTHLQLDVFQWCALGIRKRLRTAEAGSTGHVRHTSDMQEEYASAVPLTNYGIARIALTGLRPVLCSKMNEFRGSGDHVTMRQYHL
jgi:hypothetical protein